MPRPFPLHSLLEHARHRLEAAERLMRYQKRKEDEARRRMDELLGYRAEYQARLDGSAASGMGIHMLRDYHLFMAKLAKAIQAQKEEVAHAQAQWQTAHGYWTGARAKVKAYEVLAARHLADETRREDKLDQARMDELVHRRIAVSQRAGDDGEPH